MKVRHTIRQIENCHSLEGAVHLLMQELQAEKDKYYQIHELAPYHGFPVHKHLTTNEWTVICDAEFYFVTRQGTENNVQLVESFNRAIVIHVPIGICHTVRSISISSWDVFPTRVGVNLSRGNW